MYILSYKGSVVPLYIKMEPLLLDQPKTIEHESSDNKTDWFILVNIGHCRPTWELLPPSKVSKLS